MTRRGNRGGGRGGRNRNPAQAAVKPPSGAPLKPTAKLAAILGSGANITLRDANKKVWLYVKKKRLQDPHTPRIIKPGNDALEKIVVDKIVGKKKLTTYILSQCVKEHLS